MAREVLIKSENNPDIQDDKKWLVVYTTPRAEKKVYDRLKEQGIETYLPLF
ncbi:MAG: hypothetical protein B6D64_08620 [Bacteroidetes bacterium 4484_276]|nr:MAG: hypothetical protein B6D64_08620 [Bacteroidetes bacterium 4484_276]